MVSSSLLNAIRSLLHAASPPVATSRGTSSGFAAAIKRRVVLSRLLWRLEAMSFFSNLLPRLVGIEVCLPLQECVPFLQPRVRHQMARADLPGERAEL